MAIWALAKAFPPGEESAYAHVATVGTVVAFTGLYSLPPYLIFMGLARRWAKRRPSVRAIRLVVWMAPLVIAILFAVILPWVPPARPAHRELGVVAVWGLIAVIVGYAYVGLIEAGYFVGRITGRIGVGPPRSSDDFPGAGR
jgi:hypothetical protein